MHAQCEHHLLPFYGVAHIVCVPGSAGTALALRDVQALVARFSKRLQVQVRSSNVTPRVHTNRCS